MIGIDSICKDPGRPILGYSAAGNVRGAAEGAGEFSAQPCVTVLTDIGIADQMGGSLCANVHAISSILGYGTAGDRGVPFRRNAFRVLRKGAVRHGDGRGLRGGESKAAIVVYGARVEYIGIGYVDPNSVPPALPDGAMVNGRTAILLN